MWLILKTIFVFIITWLIWGIAWSFGMTALSNILPHQLQNNTLLIIINYIAIFSPPIIISTRYFRRGRKKLPEEKFKEQVKTLSEKYTILETYQALAFLLMLVVTVSYMYSFTFFVLETPLSYILPTISFIISIFSLYCLTKIIDFLFDLDKK